MSNASMQSLENSSVDKELERFWRYPGRPEDSQEGYAAQGFGALGEPFYVNVGEVGLDFDVEFYGEGGEGGEVRI